MNNQEEQQALAVFQAEENGISSAKIIQNTLVSYVKKPKEQPLEEWVAQELNRYKEVYKTQEESQKDALEIIKNIKILNKNREEITTVQQEGKSVESWVAKKIEEGAQASHVNNIGEYAHNIEKSLQDANELSLQTFVNLDGAINRNKNLHGFVAEQHHVNTFNIEASLKNSNYRAQMLQSTGKNSVDIVIKDMTNGKIVKKYGAKYGLDATATKSYLEKGDYRGQRKLVADGQHTQIENATNHIEVDGIKSKPLSYEQSRKIQAEIQEKQRIAEYKWDGISKTKIAKSIVVESGKMVLLHSLVQGGRVLGRRVYNTLTSQKNQTLQEDVKEWLKSSWLGAKVIGLQVAVTTGVTVAVRKGLITSVAKNTPVGQIANVVYVGMENTKVLYKMAKGDLGFKEGLKEMEKVSLSAVGGIVGAGEGMIAGAALGSLAGPVGTVVGGFVGSVVGGIAGSTAGELIAKANQKVRDVALKGLKKSYEGLKNAATGVFNFWKKTFTTTVM